MSLCRWAGVKETQGANCCMDEAVLSFACQQRVTAWMNNNYGLGRDKGVYVF